MRKTFKSHPEITILKLSKEHIDAAKIEYVESGYASAYYDVGANKIEILWNDTTEEDAIFTLNHELDHWMQTAFLTKKESLDVGRRFRFMASHHICPLLERVNTYASEGWLNFGLDKEQAEKVRKKLYEKRGNVEID